jgi:uncharacterized protein (DUF362 family)
MYDEVTNPQQETTGMLWTRRHCLETLVGAAAFWGLEPIAYSTPTGQPNKFSIPGLYPGRVVAVENAACFSGGKYQAAPIRDTMRRGMAELTGLPWKEAWRQFFQPGDVVGIKVNPVGTRAGVVSSPEVVHEIIAGLNAAGVSNKNIVVYERYHSSLKEANVASWLPAGVRLSYAAREWDEVQHGMDGYDPRHYVDLPLVLPGDSLKDPHARRSYAARFITTEVNKLVNLAVLKEHQAAGVTLCLKNLSHGLVNNVRRSHINTELNACDKFIPAVVSMPVIRNKAVLHLIDGIKGLYHAGPEGRPEFVWEHGTMYFGTDPVALDRIGLSAIDAKRVAAGLKPVGEAAPDQFDQWLHKQPEHIAVAGAMGLGESDEKKIDLRKIRL